MSVTFSDETRAAIEEYSEYDDRVRLHKDYSGRFMYGERCDGLVYSDATALVSLKEFADDRGLDDLAEFLSSRNHRRDNMGFDFIIY